MKKAPLILLVSILFQSCSVYYDAKEQSAYVPNVVNQNITINKHDFSGVIFAGINHWESQFNYRFDSSFTVQNNLYASKGFNLIELGVSYQSQIKNVFYFELAGGCGFGDMNYERERKYIEDKSSSGYSDNIGHVKTEDIKYHSYRGYLTPGLLIKFENRIKLSFGSRLSYTQFSNFDYSFSEIKKPYGRPKEYLTNQVYHYNSLERFGIEPYVSLHVPYKKVGLFLQMMYYGPIGSTINENTYGIMSRADIPVLMSAGFTLNLNFKRKS